MRQKTTANVAAELTRLRTCTLSPHVYRDAALHTLDTLAAMVSAARIPAGQAILRFARHNIRPAGAARSSVAGTDMRGDPVTVARVNGMLAHADETDDSHQRSLSHPGCAVVPAALAVAEARASRGTEFLRAVVAGYELTARFNMSLDEDYRSSKGSRPSSHAIGGVFGATAASATLLDLSADQVQHALAYCAQLAAGTNAFLRDRDHVLKAFVFGGMPASNGVLAATLVQDGLTGFHGVFDGSPNYPDVLASSVDESFLLDSWSEPYAVTETNFKLHSVGSPIQALVEAAEALAARIPIADIESITIHLPPKNAHVVDNNPSPNLNAGYIVAVTLADGRLSFEMAHDYDAAARQPYVSLIAKAEIRADDALAGTRGGGVTLTLASGQQVQEIIRVPRGTYGAPLDERAAIEKSMQLLTPTLGAGRAERLCHAVLNLHQSSTLGAVTDALSQPSM